MKHATVLLFCLLASSVHAKDFNIREYGGNVAKAAEAAARAGGGRVVVPAGEWTSGTIWLKDHVELHLEAGAIVRASTDKADYNANDAVPENWYSEGEEWSGGHFVFAYEATDIAVTGEGVLDGSGPKFFGECDECGRFPWYKYGLKLKPLDRDWYRPGFMLCFLKCRNVRIEGVTLKDTPCWTVHCRCCDGVVVDHITVDADRTIANSDGVSFDCTRHAILRNSTLKTGDDSVTVRASCKVPEHIARNFCEDILVENCDIWSCCGGARIGVGTGTIRNVTIRNCRIHESAVGVSFTPAFARLDKNCNISHVCISNCVVRETDRPITVHTSGGDAVTDVTISDCDFEGLNPSSISASEGGPVERIAFLRCKHRYLPRTKVRYDINWGLRQGDRLRELFVTEGPVGNVTSIDCLPRPAGTTGVLLLSFDDRNFGDWERAMPLFAKHGAHATFFVCGKIDNTAKKSLKKLAQAGHSLGLHGLTHANADQAIARMGEAAYFRSEIVPQQDEMRWSYLEFWDFAYPNCRRTEASDALFYSNGYHRVRGCVAGATPYDPKGEKQANRKPLVTNEAVFFPTAELPWHRLINTILVGESYHTDIAEILACLKRIAEKKEVLSITSHGISAGAKNINMKTEWLEAILAEAQRLGIAVLGFSELPPCRAKK